MRLIFVFIFSVFCFLNVVSAQETTNENYVDEEEYVEGEYIEEEYEVVKVNFLEFSFSLASPLGKFADKVDKSLFYGFNLAYLMQVKEEKPAFIGFEFYNMFMGSLRRTYEQSVDNEFLEVSGVMRSNALVLNLVGRYYPSVKLGSVEPFVEMHFGPKYLYSQLSESGVFSDDEEYSNLDLIKGDFVLAYGGALGFQIYLDQNLYLAVKGSYQISNSAEYYKKIDDEAGVFPLLPIDGFEIENSTTNNIKFDVGFTYLY